MQRPERVPTFLLEKIEGMDDDTRLAVAEFAGNSGSTPARIPESIKYAFALQEDAVVDEAAGYARKLAEMDEPIETDATDDDADTAPESSGIPTFRSPTPSGTSKSKDDADSPRDTDGDGATDEEDDDASEEASSEADDESEGGSAGKGLFGGGW